MKCDQTPVNYNSETPVISVSANSQTNARYHLHKDVNEELSWFKTSRYINK